MPVLTINIADKGTLLADGDKSSVGHMWFTVTDDFGMTRSFGFAPDELHHGNPFAPGQVYDNDEGNYQDRAYVQSVEIDQEQYNALTKDTLIYSD